MKLSDKHTMSEESNGNGSDASETKIDTSTEDSTQKGISIYQQRFHF